jgi:hypothetical protein
MAVMLADFDPGTLTAFYIVCGAGLVAVFCLICGVTVLCFKKWEAFLCWLAGAGIVVGLGFLLGFLSIVFAKPERFSLKE